MARGSIALEPSGGVEGLVREAGWVRAGARHVGERDGSSGASLARRAAACGAMLAVCFATVLVASSRDGGLHRGKEASRLGSLMESGSSEGRREYQLATLRGEMNADEIDIHNSKALIRLMSAVLGKKESMGAIASGPGQDERKAMDMSNKAQEYRMKADLAQARLVKDMGGKLPKEKKEQTEEAIRDDKMFATMLDRDAEKELHKAQEGRMVQQAMVKFHDRYQLSLGKKKEEKRLTKAEAALAAARQRLEVLKKGSSRLAKALPDDDKMAAAEREAMAIESLGKKKSSSSSTPQALARQLTSLLSQSALGFQ